jgi:photosystem II stability/assembly factor-like uncharacterized protein
VIAALGAFSGNTAAVTVTPGAGGVPYVPWYWTMTGSSSDPNLLLLGTSSGIYRSGDAGKTWQATGPKNVDATSLVQSGSSIYMGGVAAKPNAGPVIRKSTGRVVSDGTGVVAVSTDDGKSWKVLHPSGLPSVAVQAMAADPASSTTLYTLLNNGALYRSADGAQSFQLVSAKFGVAPWALAVAQGHPALAGDMDRGPYASANGTSWHSTPFKDTSGGHMVMEYAVQPTDSTRVIMTSRGIDISTDGGKTWRLALSSSVMFGPVAWVPGKAGVADAVGFDGSLWRSVDAGKSWKKVT